jgi:hypothetical protein
MKRIDDATELLDSAKSIIELIRSKYDEARSDEDVLKVARVEAKSALEHIRSSLEYVAVEIYQAYSKKQTKVYFPYGRDEKEFLQSLNRNLPGLSKQSPGLLSIVESIQPHVCGDDWLVKFCNATNFRKHDRLGTQQRKQSVENTITIGPGFTFKNCESVVFEGNTMNGQPISKERVVFSRSTSIKEIQKKFNPGFAPTRVFDWVEFELEGVDYDLLKLLTVSEREARRVVLEVRDSIGA